MQVPFVSCVSQMVATVSSQQTVVGNKQNICTNYSVMWTEVFFDRTCNGLQSCRTKKKRLSSYKKVFWRGLSSCGYTPPPTQAMQLKSWLSVMLMDQYWSWHVEWEGGSLQTYTATLYFLSEMSGFVASPHLMFIMTFKWYYCSRESFCSHLNCCVTKVKKKKALDGDLVSSSLAFSLFSFGCSFTTAWQAFSLEQLFSLNGPCRNWFVWPESKREKGEQKRKDTCASRLRFSSGHVTNLRARLICA